ncbi:hypothetical protein BRC19_00760 [Candidatus Saccharibacteria bacterium QS_5_54_17]|nr:MAG: hypothetical protein BRC19_00760 [Candidatus Saccharibacteria bacterium QS_5_54_17]
MRRPALYVLAGILVLVLGGIMVATNVSSHKQVADADNFSPGRLIDNSVMRDTDTMSVSDIQSFLENEMSEMGGCEERHSESNRWMDFGRDYMCLKDYKEDPTENMPECSDKYIREEFGFGSGDNRYEKAKTMCWWKGGRTNFNKSDSNAMNTNDTLGTNGKSAAQLIKDVSQKHDINPQVILVLLQKEQSLVGDSWPWIIQYQSATGFGCPDSSDCDPKYRGFYNQINQAAKFFKEIMEETRGYNYYPPGETDIDYHPDDSCGNDTVDIKNLATSALYNYTPYQPNQAALDNLYGTGNSCSTYGNRNFWRDFTDWFGSPTPSQDIVLMRNENSGAIYVINKEENLKIHIANQDALIAWGFDELPKQNVSPDQLDKYDDGGTLRRLAYERGTGKAYFADDKRAFHVRSHNQAKAWNFQLGNIPWLKQNTVNYLNKKKLTYRIKSPLDGKIYMMDSNADTDRNVIQHYPNLTTLNAWEGSGSAIAVSEAYFCQSYDDNGNCIPRWEERTLHYPKATAANTNKIFFINQGNKHWISSGSMDQVYSGNLSRISQPSLNRFAGAGKATILLQEKYDTKIYLMNQDTYHHIAGPGVYNHWKPGGDGAKTEVSGAFLNMLSKDSSVSSFTATDGTTTYYMEQNKYDLEDSLENAYTAPESPMSVSAAVLDQYPDQNGIGTPYVTSSSTNKVFYLDGSGTKHHVGSFKKLRLMRSGTGQGTFVLPHGMIKGMDTGSSTGHQFTSGTDDYVFDNNGYHKVVSDEWELSPNLNIASASLSDWFQEKPDLNNDFTVGDGYGIARNGALYRTKNLALGEVWGTGNNSTSISSRLTSFLEENNLSVLVSSQNPDNKQLYLYDGNELYHITTLAAFKNFGLGRFGGNVKMTDTEIGNLESSQKATYLLSKSDGVIDDGNRRQFPVDGGETADAWFGSNTQIYTQKLVDLFAQKTADKKVSRLITSPETNKHYCMYDGEKRWLTGPSAKDNSQCSDKSLRGVSHKLLKQIPTGDNI